MTYNQIKLAAEEADLANRPIKVLCVDDEELNLDIMEKHLKKAGYESVSAIDGYKALEILNDNGNEIDVVLLDRMMPGIDGIEVLQKMKEDPALQNVPVILQTAAVQEEEAVEGIKAGAYYYVNKPYAAEMLLSVVEAAVREHKHQRHLKKKVDKSDAVMKATTNATFEFRTLTEAREIAAHLSSLAKDPSKIIMGLTALMVNAIEHGNLEIGHDKKQELLVSGTWEEEIEKRLELPENKDKTVKVEFERGDEEVKIRIKDQGKGFEWQKFIDFEPIRMTDPNGRGIAVANITNPGCIEFIGDGSEVLYTIKL